MSRSYKHTPILKYAPTSKYNGALKEKRFANKKVRRNFCHHNSYYKKMYQTWDIHDCVSYWTWKNEVEAYYQSRNQAFYMRRELDFNYWAKCYLRK